MFVVACALEKTDINSHDLLEPGALAAAAPEKRVQLLKHQLQSLSYLEMRLLLNIALILFVHPPAESLADAVQSELALFQQQLTCWICSSSSASLCAIAMIYNQCWVIGIICKKTITLHRK